MLKTNITQWENIRVGEILIAKGLITQETLELAIQTQQDTQQRLGEILIKQGEIDELQLRRALRQQYLMKSIATLLLLSSTGILASSSSTLLREHSQISAHIQTEGVIGGALPKTDHSQVNHSQTQVSLPKLARGSLENHPHPTSSNPLVGFCHPLNGKGLLSQGNNGITHRHRMAYAYDLASPIGTPVYAMRAGRILSIRDRYPDTGGGRSQASKYNYVLIEHDGGFRSAYVHLQQDFLQTVPLKKGMTIKAGQLIGYSGNSGWSTGPHLHLEVQRPSDSKQFTKTVPFKVSGRCAPSDLANAS